MVWLVVYSKPRQESVAAENLRRQGFEVFLPQLTQRKRRASKWQVVTEPLFPRYLFTEVALGEQSTAAIRSTLGIVGLVRFGEHLAQVEGRTIDFLREQQHPAPGARLEADTQYAEGDRVEITEGAFAGLSGIFTVANGMERVTLLMDLLGRQTPILVDRKNLGDVV
jgi:transcriptional antiterminator RfaH